MLNKMTKNEEIAIVIDGNSLTYRAYYATINQLDYFKKYNIKPNNAIKTMLIMSLKILKQYNPKYTLIAFDAGKSTFRNELYKEYKSNRSKTPLELIEQITLLHDIMKLCGYNVCLQNGIEADDIIGSFANLTNANNIHCKIFSSDKDMLQLVNKNTEIHKPEKGVSEMQIYNIDNFENLLDGLSPEQIVDYKGIVGDSSDNLPGIKGIGKKTGIKLIKKYKTLDNIFNNLNDLSNKQKQLFIESENISKLCKELATIKTDLFLNKNINDFLRKPIETENLFDFLNKYKINNMEKYIFDVE
ncbi:5'-3' exonuclease [Mycoplasmoides pirum]|uniref:5'-3' exonuclease n=1 Tax=Mycoplasmoides pirum TaxID=2122 RepID=UPI0004807096|nr:5'-3' exonuclease [Mycoplasmoides pirum]